MPKLPCGRPIMACARSEICDSSPCIDQQGAVMTNPSVSETVGANYTCLHEAHQGCAYETDKSIAQRFYDKKDKVCPRALCLSQGALRCSVRVITIDCIVSGTAMKRGVVFRGVCILQKLQPDQLNTFKKGLRESRSMLLCFCAVLKDPCLHASSNVLPRLAGASSPALFIPCADLCDPGCRGNIAAWTEHHLGREGETLLHI